MKAESASILFCLAVASCSDGARATASDGGSPPTATPNGGSICREPIDSGSNGGEPIDGASPDADAYAGSFKILVLSEIFGGGFHDDSIPAAHQMLRDLGQCVDAPSCAKTNDELIAAAKPNSAFTVDVAGCDPSATGCNWNTPQAICDFNEANLASYQMIVFAGPSGLDFSGAGASGQAAMAALQKFMLRGGGFAAVNATGFEPSNGFAFYTDMTGARFDGIAASQGPSTIVVQPEAVDHPVVAGLPAMWTTVDKWHCMKTDIGSLPGFQVLARQVSSSGRGCTDPAGENPPATWVSELPAMDPAGLMTGRVFYTVMGSNYAEPIFRNLVHRGILWAAHRLEN